MSTLDCVACERLRIHMSNLDCVVCETETGFTCLAYWVVCYVRQTEGSHIYLGSCGM